MLLHLRIRSLAIIDAVELDFAPGFTVITGETGAGKSILINALGLLLGGRSSADSIRTGADQAEVEAMFDIAEQPIVRARMEQRQLLGDDPNILLIRRVISAKGRAKVVINGHLSTVATLSELVRGLVDISGQHEQQSLLVVENHRDIIDAYGGLEVERTETRQAFEDYRALHRELRSFQTGEDELLRRMDFLRFQLEEIENVAPRVGEDDSLEEERSVLAHAEKLRIGTGQVEGWIYGDDGSAFDRLGKATAELDALSQVDGTLAPVCEFLHSARRDIEEAARTLQCYGERVEVDPERLCEVEDRLAEIQRLLRKHGGSIADVLARAQRLNGELSALENRESRLSELEENVRHREQVLLKRAEALSELRHKAAEKFCRAVRKELEEMDLPNAKLEVRFARRAESGAEGFDEIELMWSANPGEPPKPLAKIASGGELSRLMLGVKAVLRHRDLVSLYVFDEVDTGLGGKAADCIGRKIQSVAEGHQAVTVTHLAQIASRADHHLKVHKGCIEDRTVSVFEHIRGQERADEIARMIDGAEQNTATLRAAKAMLNRSMRAS